MMKGFKKGVALSAAFVMAATTLTGCGAQKVDGTATVAVCNEENISMGLAALYTRMQQAQTFNMYYSYLGTTNVFSQVLNEEAGQTYGEDLKDTSMETIKSLYLLRQHAEEYNVALTEDELAAITASADAFMAANDANALAATGISKEAVEELLNLYTYQTKMYAAMVADVDTEVSDEEAKQSKVTYVRVGLDGTEEDADGNIIDLTEDEVAAKKELAETILENVIAAGANADFDAIAKGVDETLAATSTTYGADTTTVDASILAAVEGLADGTVVDKVVASEDGKSLYIVRFDADLDRTATDSQKQTIISTRQSDDFNAEVEGWMSEVTFELKEDVWNTLKVNDTQIYNLYAPAETAQ